MPAPALQDPPSTAQLLLTLQDVTTPSRATIDAAKSKAGGGGVKTKGGEVVLPPYFAPEPRNQQERREWERMAVRMESFHSYFRAAFKQLFELADGSFERHGLSVGDFMDLAEDFLRHLEWHHGFEERNMFPFLAKRMPQFAEPHQEEHDAIHAGLQQLEVLISKYRASPTSYSSTEFRTSLASWGPVLFYHLDAEVQSLSGDVLRRYWTLEDLRRLLPV
ncbi:hypothetical protein JCM10207_007424 [Rhodosporidiobolus poonsookiae]